MFGGHVYPKVKSWILNGFQWQLVLGSMQ